MENNTTRGGKRAGAGRKRGLASIRAEEARKYVVDRVAQELGPILTGQIESAKGIYYEQEDEQGIKIVYKQLPDLRASTYLLNQLIGHPKATIDMNVQEPFSLKRLAEERRKLEAESPNANEVEISLPM